MLECKSGCLLSVHQPHQAKDKSENYKGYGGKKPKHPLEGVEPAIHSARILCLSANTVKVYVRFLAKKLNATSRTGIVSKALSERV